MLALKVSWVMGYCGDLFWKNRSMRYFSVDYGASVILTGHQLAWVWGRKTPCLDVLGEALFGGASRSTTHSPPLLIVVPLPPCYHNCEVPS